MSDSEPQGDSEYQPYEWPDLFGDPWHDWVDESIERHNQALLALTPDTVLNWGSDTDNSTIDGSQEDDGNTPIVDGNEGDVTGDTSTGTGSDGLAGIESPIDPPHMWIVITPEVSGQTDVQMLGTTAGAVVPGAILRNVTVPSGMEALTVGDWGTVRRVLAGTAVFAPIPYQAHAGTFVTPDTLGSTGETEAANTNTFNRASPTTGTDGLSYTRLTRMAFSDTGDQTLYGYYRTEVYDSLGKLVTVSAETRVAIDVPEVC